MAFKQTAQAAVKNGRAAKYKTNNAAGYVFIAPVMLGILIFTLVPMLWSLYLSFSKTYNVISPPTDFGTYNYMRMFRYDTDMWKSIGITFLYTAVNLPLSMTLSFLLALALNNKKIKGMGVYRLLIYTPVIIPVTVSGLLWKNVTNYDYGLINSLLQQMGFGKFGFFEKASTSMGSFIFIGLWAVGGGMVLWLSSLKNVSASLYEAAELDGAGAFKKLVCITLPMCTPMIFYNVIMGVINSLQTFGSVFTLTGGSAGAKNSLYFWLMKIYNDTFNINAYSTGYAAAECWLLFLVIAVLTVLVFRTSKWVYYGEEA